MFAPFDSFFHALLLFAVSAMLVAAISLLGGIALAEGLRMHSLRWSWAGTLLAPATLLCLPAPPLGLTALGICTVGGVAGLIRHSSDLAAGGEVAKIARERLGVFAAIELLAARWRELNEGVSWLKDGRLTVGRDEWGRRVTIPAEGLSGAHTLILGATGSGKTCTEAWIAARLVERGHGAVVVDPKGDETLREELRAAALRAAKPFLEWTPEGPCSYNPYAHGTPSEIANKALACETFTEPHYLRMAQRYLEHVLRSMCAAGVPVTPASLMAHMSPDELERTARVAVEARGPQGTDDLPSSAQDGLCRGRGAGEGLRTEEYVQSLTERQKRDLAGVRDRLSILAESDMAAWLDPERAGATIDLAQAVASRWVAYFALDADRRPLLAQMLGGAIVSDLVTVAAERQHDPRATVVVIDEFAALAAEQVTRLFGRSKSAGISMVLATQELADLASVGRGVLHKQIMGNLASTIAFRQNVPESAELIAGLAGSEPAWVRTQWTRGVLPVSLLARGMRRRDREYAAEPTQIMRLTAGEALVIAHAGGQPATVARMCHPGEIG